MSIQFTPTICSSHPLTFLCHCSSCHETPHSEVLFSCATSLLLGCAQVHSPVIPTQDLTLDMASAFPHSSEGAPLTLAWPQDGRTGPTHSWLLSMRESTGKDLGPPGSQVDSSSTRLATSRFFFIVTSKSLSRLEGLMTFYLICALPLFRFIGSRLIISHLSALCCLFL